MKELCRQVVGLKGEQAAAAFLRNRGMTWVASNWRSKWGEIDLIMRDGETLVFVEVKTRRKNDRFGAPQEAVTHRKKERMVKGALSYLQKAGLEDCPVRFDVVSVGVTGIRHFLDAVEGSGHYYT